MADEQETPDAGGQEEPPAEGVEQAPEEQPPAPEGVEKPARTGWYRSPGGHIAHADGPDQRRAFGDRGWTEISEDQAKEAIAAGLDLRVDPTDAKGTFDEDAVAQAVRDESTATARRRRRTP